MTPPMGMQRIWKNRASIKHIHHVLKEWFKAKFEHTYTNKQNIERKKKNKKQSTRIKIELVSNTFIRIFYMVFNCTWHSFLLCSFSILAWTVEMHKYFVSQPRKKPMANQLDLSWVKLFSFGSLYFSRSNEEKKRCSFASFNTI